jgi:RNA polymerase sigma factor (sigma-70 family)
MYKPEEQKECLANNIRLYCKNNNLTYRDFAALLGMSEAAIQKWLQLVSLPDPKAQKALEKLFSAKFEKICSNVVAARLMVDHTQTLEDIFPYNFIIATVNYSLAGVAIMSYFEDINNDDEFDMSYRNVTPFEFDRIFRDRLNYREQAVVEMRYRDSLTLEEAGKKLGLTRERVRQIEFKALRKVHFALKELFASKTTIEQLKEENEQLKQYAAGLEAVRLLKPTPEPVKRVALSDIIVEDMDFSIRTYNCLKRSQLNTLHDIVNYDKPFTNIRNLGRQSLDEIISAVIKFNLGYTYDTECGHFIRRPVS